MAGYQDNIEQSSLQEDIKESMSFLLQHAGFIERPQWERLSKAVLAHWGEAEPEQEGLTYDANFSMANELQAQILAVRAVRDRIMSPDGGLVADISTREAKEVISSGSTLVATLMKYHEKVVNMERMRLLEQAVVQVLEEADPTLKDQVMIAMEEKLSLLT